MSPQDMLVHPALLKTVRGDAFPREWVFWVDMWTAKRDAAAVGGSVQVLKEVGTVRCMKEYWGYFNGLPLSKMCPGSSLHICVGSVRPVWEDPAHRTGGRLKLECSTTNDGFKQWLDLCLAVLGGQFPHASLITGVSFSASAPGTHNAFLWLKEQNAEVKDFLESLLSKGDGLRASATWACNEAAYSSSLSRGVVRECVENPNKARRRSTSAPHVPQEEEGEATKRVEKTEKREDMARLSSFVGKKRVSIMMGSQVGQQPKGRPGPGHRRRHTDSGKEEFIPKHALTLTSVSVPPSPVSSAPPSPEVRARVPTTPVNVPVVAAAVTLHSPVPPAAKRDQERSKRRRGVAAEDVQGAAAAAVPAASVGVSHGAGSAAGGGGGPPPLGGMPPSQAFVHLGTLYPEGLTRKQRRAILFSHNDAEELGCPPGRSLPFPHGDGSVWRKRGRVEK